MTGPAPAAGAKDALRARLGAARRAMPEPVREAARAAVRAAVLERCRTEGWRCVAAYVPLRTEPGSVELLAGLVTLGARVLVPSTLADNDLDWTPWPGATPPVTLGRDAIGDADAILVPALAVSSDGTRLGRGGGSYDRALPRRRPSAVVAALLFDDEVLSAVPADAWDQPVDAVASPSGWLALTGRS